MYRQVMPSIGDLQADLASLWSLASSLAQWQADLTAATARALGIALPLTETSAVVLELECGLRCNLKRFTQVSVMAQSWLQADHRQPRQRSCFSSIHRADKKRRALMRPPCETHDILLAEG